jgi:hypothetical protein
MCNTYQKGGSMTCPPSVGSKTDRGWCTAYGKALAEEKGRNHCIHTSCLFPW